MKTFNGKTVLITGAAMGMGRLHAQRAVAEGAAAVVLWDLNEVALSETAGSLGATGSKVIVQVVDVSSVDAIKKAADKVRRDVGRVDVLINNAGIVRGKLFWEHDHTSDIWLTIAVNALAPMHITREFLPAMIASGSECHVVNIASASGLLSVPKMSAYVASKWAAIGWSDSLRLELQLAGHGHVHVTTACPSYVATGMFSGAKAPLMTPILTPESVVDEIWKGLKADRPFVFMPWTVMLSRALKGLLPTALFDLIADKVFHVYGSMSEFQGRNEPGALAQEIAHRDQRMARSQ